MKQLALRKRLRESFPRRRRCWHRRTSGHFEHVGYLNEAEWLGFCSNCHRFRVFPRMTTTTTTDHDIVLGGYRFKLKEAK